MLGSSCARLDSITPSPTTKQARTQARSSRLLGNELGFRMWLFANAAVVQHLVKDFTSLPAQC